MYFPQVWSHLTSNQVQSKLPLDQGKSLIIFLYEHNDVFVKINKERTAKLLQELVEPDADELAAFRGQAEGEL